MTSRISSGYEPLEGGKGSRPDRPLDSLELGSNRPSRFLTFLAYAPVLIFSLTLGLWLFLIQNSTKVDIDNHHYAVGELVRLPIGIEELRELSAEAKVPSTLLEEQATPASRQIATFESKSTSADSEWVSRNLKNQSHIENEPYYHEVQTGETLYRIARKYRLTVKQLLDTNDLNQNYRIYPGQKILIIRDPIITVSRSDR